MATKAQIGAGDLAFSAHDHGQCCADALSRADAMAQAAGARLTPVRRRVLEILLESHRALGAYQILDRLAAEGFGNQPPVAYRALEFLEKQGLVHRIRGLNAFTACTHAGQAHAPAFLVCRSCEAVAEAALDPARRALSEAAAALGFRVESSVIEAVGLCPACQKGAACP